MGILEYALSILLILVFILCGTVMCMSISLVDRQRKGCRRSRFLAWTKRNEK